ncbi:Fc.00g048050.m01.CDS01 [Cosmosporella sp. VM-42]
MSRPTLFGGFGDLDRVPIGNHCPQVLRPSFICDVADLPDDGLAAPHKVGSVKGKSDVVDGPLLFVSIGAIAMALFVFVFAGDAIVNGVSAND